MKFKLFERLRDDDDSEEQNNSNASQGLGEPNMDQMGGSLERTVENMFDQGYSEEEIMQELQGQYTEPEIQRAVNNTVTNNATPSDGPEPMSPYQSDEGAVSPMDEGYQQEEGQEEPQAMNQSQDQGPQSGGKMQDMEQSPPQNPQQNQPQQSLQQQGPPQEPAQREGEGVDPQVEELVETIVAENFQRVTAEFQNVYEELDALEEEVEELDHRVHDLEVRDDEDQEQFVQKVEEMENHIDSYQSRIGGLEKAFQQVLPNLVDNVRDLTQLVQEIKQEKGIETSTNISEQEMEDMDQLEDW